jgi:hypothetical protein
MHGERHKGMINILEEKCTNYSNLLITHHTHVENYCTVPHKYVQLLCDNLRRKGGKKKGRKAKRRERRKEYMGKMYIQRLRKLE